MRSEAWGVTVGLAIIGIGAALTGIACRPANPASPSTTTATSTTATSTATPIVEAISPAMGGELGGTVVTITGTNFVSGASVSIGGAYATSVSVQSGTTIVATTPAGSGGTADVVVTVNSKSGKLAGGFTYLPPVETALTFTVYNHTAGRLGSWTATLQSGTTATLSIGALGELVDEDGNVVQAAIPVDSADGQRMVVREGAAAGRVGDFVSSSTTGTLSLVVPYKDRASFDVFVMNAQNGSDYSLVDSGALAFERNLTISRGADSGGATGPEEAIDILVRELAWAVTLPWMSYGRVTRVSGDGQIFVNYTQPNAGACVTYTRSRGMLYVNPEKCAAVPVDVRGAVLENGFELVSGVRDIGGADSSGLLDWDTYRLTPTARDLLAYVFLKDSKGW